MKNNLKQCLTFLEMELSRPKLLAKPKKQTKIFGPVEISYISPRKLSLHFLMDAD